LTFFAASFFPRLICRSRFSVFALPVTIFFLGSGSVIAATFHREQASLLVNRAKVLLCSFFWLPLLFSLGFGSLLVLSHRRRQDERLGPRLRFRSPRRRFLLTTGESTASAGPFSPVSSSEVFHSDFLFLHRISPSVLVSCSFFLRAQGWPQLAFVLVPCSCGRFGRDLDFVFHRSKSQLSWHHFLRIFAARLWTNSSPLRSSLSCLSRSRRPPSSVPSSGSHRHFESPFLLHCL
jgi:hypothetical protein